jgi:hypothetical protein
MDWSKAVQASSVQVPKNWGLVRARSKNFSDWIGLDLDGPGPDWSIAGLVESLAFVESSEVIVANMNEKAPMGIWTSCGGFKLKDL